MSNNNNLTTKEENSNQTFETEIMGAASGTKFQYIDEKFLDSFSVSFYEQNPYEYIICGVQITTSDGSQIEYGNYSGPLPLSQPVLKRTIYGLSQETLKECKSRYGTTQGASFCGIYLKTLTGEEFKIGPNSGWNKISIIGKDGVDPYYIVGIYGYVWENTYDPYLGATINGLGFILKKDRIVDQRLTNFNYQPAPLQKPVVDSTILAELKNELDIEESRHISKSESITSTSIWKHQAGIEVKASTELETGIPFVAKGRIEVSASTNFVYTWGDTKKETQTVTFTSNVIAPPHSKVTAQIQVFKSNLDLSYDAHYQCLYEHSRPVNKPFSGTYRGVSSHDVSIVYDETEIN